MIMSIDLKQNFINYDRMLRFFLFFRFILKLNIIQNKKKIAY